MSDHHDEHIAKAGRLLQQAQAVDANDAPESIVHLSYYAMFHAATAVLIKHRDESSRTHVGLIGAFGRFVKDRGETARGHGRALNRAEDLRLQADYGVSYNDLSESAENILNDARVFIDYCEKVVLE